MDDITPDMDWDKFSRFKAILDRHSVKPLIGVVPDNKDKKLQIDKPAPDFWQYIQKLQKDGWVVAMHGYNHRYTTKEAGIFPIGGKSEFAGLSLYVQDEMIREGRRILKSNGILTDVFMAPSHSFDRNTIKALKKNGFKTITDGFGNRPYIRQGLTFIPLAFKKSMAIKSKKGGITTFVYHTNTMNDKDFASFEKLLNEVNVESYSECFNLEPKKFNIIDGVIEYTLAKTKYTLSRLRKLLKKS